MGKNVLLVEDNPDNSMLTEKILSFNKYVTKIADSGKTTLEYINTCTEKPDIILMDITLPDIDGTELTKQILQKEGFENIPIIAVTGHAEKEVEEKATSAGCKAVLVKPFTPDQLIQIIEQYISRS
jgi:two-component system, cell cycle response regulator DivK